MKQHLYTVNEASELIRAGTPLILAGSEAALDQLPAGNWIGGTIPYFMVDEGGLQDDTRVFVTHLPHGTHSFVAKLYDRNSLPQLVSDGPNNGFIFVIIPAFSSVHHDFAENAPDYKDMYIKPVVGWVSGCSLDTVGKVSPKVYHGPDLKKVDDQVAAFHVSLSDAFHARVDIVNLFTQDEGPTITFSQTAFDATTCLVDGVPQNLAQYIAEHQIDTRLPLVANLCGAMINTSIAKVDLAQESVAFYAPVFLGAEYRFAKPIGDYATEFLKQVPTDTHHAFACNCILNYLYGELEGKKLGEFAGPITFGEVAYQLLNQTMVYLEIDEAA